MHLFKNFVWYIYFCFLQLDDWVLCRIYKKTHASPPSASAAAAAASDHDHEEEDEEEEQYVQETLLPSLKNPLSNKSLMPQKSSSFSNLLDAMDYSMLRTFLSDHNQFNINPTGYDSTPSSLLNGAIPEQNFFSNCNPPANSSSSYLIQKLPQLSNPIPNIENKLKRPFSSVDEDMHHHPSKKLLNSCSFTNSTSQTDIAYHQYNFLNQPFLNQQLLLNPHHLQFQGQTWPKLGCKKKSRRTKNKRKKKKKIK